jgi:uncharacterized protein YdhG (YjbR/CyaY superfamily)
MDKSGAGSRAVDEYIAALPEPTQAVLRRARAVIHKAVPAAEETISYKMPTFRLHGRPLVHIAGWKEHWALYPASGHVVAALQAELTGHQVSKGTIRFALDAPVPVKLLERIAKLRAAELTASQAAKSKAKPKQST